MKFYYFIVLTMAVLFVGCANKERVVSDNSQPQEAPRNVGVFTYTEHANFLNQNECCDDSRDGLVDPRFRRRDTGAPDSHQDWRDRNK